MPELARLTIRPDGRLVSTPPLDNADKAHYTIVLEGTFQFDYSDERFDAVFRYRPDGTVLGRHDFLAWSDRAPRLMSEDSQGHRYVFQVPENWAMDGRSLAVGLDLPAMIRAYQIPDTEILQNLRGELRMVVDGAPLAPPVWIWPGLGVPAMGLAAAAAWVLRRRMAFSNVDAELRRTMAALQIKTAAALKIAATQRRSGRALKRRIRELQRGALVLSRRLTSIRQSLLLADDSRTISEIAALEGRLSTVTEPSTRHELESALEHKRKAAAAAAELRAAEERFRLRLTKIEGVIDSACLQLQRADSGRDAGPVEDVVLRELDSEVRAVGEIAKEAEQQAYLYIR